MASINFNETLLHMDVLCAAHYLDFILAGIGNNLFVYSNESLLLSQPIFIGERIHSICVRNNLILLKGGRQFSLVKLEKLLDKLECQIVSKIKSTDWIQDIIILEEQLAGLVTAHNFFEYWNLGAEKRLSIHSCEEKCIFFRPNESKNLMMNFYDCCKTILLKTVSYNWQTISIILEKSFTANDRYSCKITGNTLDTLVILVGTVFGDVLIWAPFLEENHILKRFKAHNGAVFSIDTKPKDKLLTTTSDDRSLKIWCVISPVPVLNGISWKNSTIQLVHTLFGHTARVWKSLILPDYYLTIGEDSQLVVWSRDCRIIKTLHLHQESGIRALHYSSETNMITTGGEDGGINTFSLKYLITQNEPFKILNLKQNVSTKICFTESGYVYILNGSCIAVTDTDEEVVYKSENFASYCLLEVSREGKYIIMGSLKGYLVIIDSNTKAIVVEEKVLDGRIYSIHWLGRFLLTCGPEGRLDLWKLSGASLKNISTMILPNCRERWTTCGVIQNEKLIVGDRMGNLHIYELHGDANPVKSFRKIHSYLGVTDIFVVDDVCLSIGRDGTVKEFTKNFIHLFTCKLSMEWPWKILKYKNDLLILGFHGVSFVVWSMKEREVIASHDCGGGHRSCDYKLQKNNLSFVYVKDKKIFIVDLVLDGITRIRSGFHGKVINCLKILQTRPIVIVTGSEDTTVRVSTVEKSELKQVEVMKTHISSIRALCVCSLETKLIFVSVGGKGQVVIWDFNLNTLKCQELVSHLLKTETRNWKSSKLAIDPVTRIMCAGILKLENEFVIATGCSDCHIRIFSYSGILNLLCTISYTHCLLNIAILKMGLTKILVSMGTDGKVVFWDVTNFSQVKQLKGFSVHQSGINSFQFEEIECGKFILATGGDDNLISVALVEITGEKVNLSQVWENSTTHSCQITGIAILKSFLITTSVDQRITVWNWSWQKDKFHIEFLNQYMTAVPDIQGMDATWLNNFTILVIVHGKGMEVLQIDVTHSCKKVDDT